MQFGRTTMTPTSLTVLLGCSVLLTVGLLDATSIEERFELEQLREALRRQEDAADSSDSESSLVEKDNTEVASQSFTACSKCLRDSECCQLDGATFQCCAKIYISDKEQVSFDRENELAISKLPDGSINVADFKKGLMFRYDKPAKKCYLAPGLDYTLEDVIDVVEGDTKDNKASKLAYFEETNAKPIEDHSLLPAVLKDPCKDVPLSWHEKVLNQESKSTRNLETIGLQTRGWNKKWKKAAKVGAHFGLHALIGK